MNDDSRVGRESRQQPEKVVFGQRDTARRRRESLSREMDENGATPTGYARLRIMVDFNDEVVKAVGPP